MEISSRLGAEATSAVHIFVNIFSVMQMDSFHENTNSAILKEKVTPETFFFVNANESLH